MTEKEACYEIIYASAIYNGITNKIEFAKKHIDIDQRKELAYMVQRYCNEVRISGTFLQEKLEEYNKFAEEKFGKLESEVD